MSSVAIDAIERELIRRMIDDWELRDWFHDNFTWVTTWPNKNHAVIAILCSRCTEKDELMEEAREWGEPPWCVREWLIELYVGEQSPETNSGLVKRHWELRIPEMRRRMVEMFQQTKEPVYMAVVKSLQTIRPWEGVPG